MSENAHAGQGSVLLDIGGEVGALVVSMPASTVGMEIEIEVKGNPHGGHHHRRAHVAVVDRPVSGGTLPSLVFPELVEGGYDLFEKGDDAVRMSAEVIGGQVTFASWVG